MSDDKKKLYDESDRFTPEVSQFDREVRAALGGVFVKWLRAGYRPRELSHAAIATVMDLESFVIVQANKLREERDAKKAV